MRLIKIFRMVLSMLRFLIYKMCYINRFTVRFPCKQFLGRSTFIDIEKNGKVRLEGKLTCRNNVKFKVTSGLLIIGDNVFINNDSSITCHDGITIGDNVLMGEGVRIYDHDHQYDGKGLIRDQGFRKAKVRIGSNVWIGSNVIVLKGVTIGSNSVISAGTILRKDVSPNSLVYNASDAKEKEIICDPL